MTDVVGKEKRSQMMRGIRGKNTTPEIRVRKALHALGFRYRLYQGDLAGKPDLVFAKHNAVLFVHGCYWHRHHNCKLASTPSSNTQFWQEKFAGNIKRDQQNIRTLRDAGWCVGIVWECALRSKDISQAMQTVAKWLRSDIPDFEYPKPLGRNINNDSENTIFTR